MSERLIDSVCPHCGRLGTTVRVVKHEDGYTKLSRLCKECGGEWIHTFDADWLAVANRRRLEAEVERLTRERDEARKESDRLYTECGQLWDEYKKMCETIRTIGARCVELDDREAVSAILDIVEKVLEEYKP